MANTLEEFREECQRVFKTLTDLGPVVVPCPAPQPWNDHRYVPMFSALCSPFQVPKWQFSARAIWQPSNLAAMDSEVFSGLLVTVRVRDSSHDGKSASFILTAQNLENLDSHLAGLEASRVAFMRLCSHPHTVLVENLGPKTYNRYRCKDCGREFNIDTGD